MHLSLVKNYMKPPFLNEINLDFSKGRLIKKLWALSRCNRQARKLREQMPNLVRDLEAACKDVEPEFIQIGQELQIIYRDARELTVQVVDSINVMGGKNGEGVLPQLRDIAEQSLAELEGCQGNVAEKTDLIRTVMEHLGSLSAVWPSVEKVGLLLRVVAVNVGIETARSKGSRELFSVVAQETRKLSDKIEATSDGAADVLEKARSTQQSLYRDLSEGLKTINLMGKDARRIVQEAVREIERMMGSAIQMAEQAGEHSRRISEQVGNLVAAVQFHDSMSQRVEHITKALADVEHLLDGDGLDNGDGDQRKDLSHARSVINLQLAQLKGIIGEIGRVYETGVRSFDDIMRQFDALSNCLSGASAGQELNGRLEDPAAAPFERLRSSFIDLNGVLHRSQGLMEPVSRAGFQASHAVEQVSGIVKEIYEIEFETHLMALNAIVKTAHLGSQGSALEVLAQEVKKSSDQCSSIMERTDELLGFVTGVAEKLRDQNANAESEVSLKGALEEITRVYDRFMECSAHSRERAGKIRQAIGKTKSNLDFLPLLAERLTESLNQLEITASELVSFAPDEPHQLNQGEVDQLIVRYTMEKEREVHEACFSEPSNRGDRNEMPDSFLHADGKMEDGENDNVELFIGDTAGHFDEPSGKSGGPGCKTILSPVSEPKETREDVRESSENEMTRENEEDLGDNVELF